jgi:hypothetical protein
MFTPNYTVLDGVREVASALSASVSRIHLRSPIARLSTDAANPAHMTLELGSGEVLHGFAHVIFATQANSAAHVLRMYKDAVVKPGTKEERQMEHVLQNLNTFHYVRNLVINHSDDQLLPPAEQDRRELNLATWSTPFVPAEKTKIPGDDSLQVSRSFTMATHIVPRPNGAEAVYQTTNPTVPISPSTIRSVAKMERAVLTLQSKSARTSFVTVDGNLGAAQGARAVPGGPQVWFCGSYAGDGIPLLEGCVVSARAVIEKGIFEHERVRAQSEPW